MRKLQSKIKNEKKAKTYRRKLSIRKKVNGSAERPRVCMIKTNKHIQIQVINDDASKTLFCVQTFGKNAVGTNGNKDSAKLLGVKVAELLKGSKITKAVFDRNGKLYAGVVAMLADTIRENGIQI
ncbi:MAG: 50S ribosomal protein L18 [Bacteriovoracaceae bacterium]|nr:50S ribosomal protein L18 [Bacteriovoracaceae bacterium]